jgi:chromate reductase, NAD(P)H dehydrogenase (quinone)
MNIIAISGSLRKASLNTALLRALPALAPPGMTIEIATLHDIPVYDGDDEAAFGKPAKILALDAAIRAAHGVIISTPEYNFSIPGGLKNATDWLSRGGSPFRWKPVGIMGAADGPLGSGRSQYHLRQNLQGLEAITMPKPEVFVGNASTKFDAAGQLTDQVTREFLGKWLVSFAAWVAKLNP